MKGNWNLNSLMKFLPNDMTDLAWQQYFSELKNEVKPSSQENMTSRNYIDVDGRIESTHLALSNSAKWMSYCAFINNILNTIRKGKKDYCFFVYQVADLLQFEHDRLKAKWLPKYECFEVRLE